MPSKTQIKRTFRNVEIALERCWRILLPIKNLEVRSFVFQDIHDFQMSLAKTIHTLVELRHSCCRQRTILIRAKKKCSAEGIIKSLREIGTTLESIDTLIRVSKVLSPTHQPCKVREEQE